MSTCRLAPHFDYSSFSNVTVAGFGSGSVGNKNINNTTGTVRDGERDVTVDRPRTNVILVRLK